MSLNKRRKPSVNYTKKVVDVALAKVTAAITEVIDNLPVHIKEAGSVIVVQPENLKQALIDAVTESLR